MTTLTLEQMRADLAQILLEDPADIHDDDNLIDLDRLSDVHDALRVARQMRESNDGTQR